MITITANPQSLLCPIVAPSPGGVPVTVSTPDGVIGCWLRAGSRFAGMLPLTVAGVDANDARNDLLFGSFRTDGERASATAAAATAATATAKKAARLQALRDIKARIKAVVPGSRSQGERDVMAIVRFILAEDE